MKAVFICGFAVALLGTIILTASSETTNSLPLLVPGVTNLFSAEAQVALKPQVYQATPYAGIVLVSKSVDTSMLISPPSTNQFAIRIIQPEPPLRLEPRK